MFSIVIPLYNKELSIPKTLQSVLNQTFVAFEVVIVNDGSTDKSVEKVEAFNDPRIRLIHQVNAGVSAARNRGIEEAKYEWICFLDADDLWDKDYLQYLNETISTNKDIKVISSGFTLFYSDKNKVPNIPNCEGIEDYFSVFLSNKRTVTHSSAICVNKDVFKNVGLFNNSLTHGEDIEMWERIAFKYDFYFINKTLTFYKLDAENMATKKNKAIHKTRIYTIDKKKFKTPKQIEYFHFNINEAAFNIIKSKQIINFLRLMFKQMNISWVVLFPAYIVKHKILSKSYLIG